jgi:hypothetical protein
MPDLRRLGEQAILAGWQSEAAIDWSTEVPFGEPLGDDSGFAMASFAGSPLAAGGRDMWDRFRWELQAWMVGHFLQGERSALEVSARLLDMVPEADARAFLATQVVDETRHVEVLSRYVRDHVPDPYPSSEPLAAVLGDVLADPRWDVVSLGMHVIIEGLAMAAFRMADRTFNDDLIRRIARLLARDEARHVAFGVIALQAAHRRLGDRARREREDVVLDAAALIRHRFLLEEVWDRLGIDRAAGTAYAATDELMVRYRRTILARVVASLERIGLLTDRVRAGLASLDMLTATEAPA